MINRENYEEFFLSYVDNELPAEQRTAVERFVAAHPDLREELETLLQCRMYPETDAVFPDKSSLLQYEESFLLYVDGELDEAGKEKVEELIRRQPRLERELQQLLMTVSQPDPAVVFPDKESLFRSDRRRRVVLLPWLQVGAAAAILAAIVLLALPHSRKAEPASGTAAVSAGTTKNPALPVTSSATSPLYPGKKDQVAQTGTIAKDADKEATSRSGGNNTPAIATPPKTPTLPAPAVAETKSIAGGGNGSEQLAVTAPTRPTSSTRPTTSTQLMTSTQATNSTQIVTPADAATTIPEKTAAPATTVAFVNIPKEQSSFATQALLKETQENGNNDVADNLSQTTSLPEAPGKTKLRGLFRRVTRAFGKTAERDDDGQRQVSISVFQVPLK